MINIVHLRYLDLFLSKWQFGSKKIDKIEGHLAGGFLTNFDFL